MITFTLPRAARFLFVPIRNSTQSEQTHVGQSAFVMLASINGVRTFYFLHSEKKKGVINDADEFSPEASHTSRGKKGVSSD
nr:hypothetical protein [Clostridia bacterium]